MFLVLRNHADRLVGRCAERGREVGERHSPLAVRRGERLRGARRLHLCQADVERTHVPRPCATAGRVGDPVGEGDALGRENTVPLDRCDGEEGASNLPLDESAAIGEGVLRVRDVVGRCSDPQPPLPPDLDLLCESHPPVELLLARGGVAGELP